MVTTLQSVKVLSVNVPAILVTGKDANGNEFGYRKRGDEWVDYYNESITTAERIRRDVFPNVQYVRYPISGVLEYKMSRTEWIENGCPLDLPKSVVETMIDTQPHPVDEAQTIEREIDKALQAQPKRMALSAIRSKVTVSRSWAERHLNTDEGFAAALDKAFGVGNWAVGGDLT